MHSPVETVERQVRIIHEQADIIKEFFEILLQHISAEEADRLLVTEKMRRIYEEEIK